AEAARHAPKPRNRALTPARKRCARWCWDSAPQAAAAWTGRKSSANEQPITMSSNARRLRRFVIGEWWGGRVCEGPCPQSTGRVVAALARKGEECDGS